MDRYKWIQNTYLFFLAFFAATLSTAAEKVTLISQAGSHSTPNRWSEKELLVRFELNSSEKVILCNGDTSATYRFSDILLEYDAILEEPTIGEMYTGRRSILYTKVTSIHYQTLSKKEATQLIFTINGMLHQLFAAGLQVRDIYPGLKKYFYKVHSNVTWEEFLTTIFGLWIDTRYCTIQILVNMVYLTRNGSFDESFNFHKQLLRNYRNII